MLAHVGDYGGAQCEQRLVTGKPLLQGVHQTVPVAWVGDSGESFVQNILSSRRPLGASSSVCV